MVATFSFAQMIIQESALSFLGLGMQPPRLSWGSMLSDARSYLVTAWWIDVLPGVAIVATVLSVNVVGERLRDLLDPRPNGARLSYESPSRTADASGPTAETFVTTTVRDDAA